MSRRRSEQRRNAAKATGAKLKKKRTRVGYPRIRIISARAEFIDAANAHADAA